MVGMIEIFLSVGILPCNQLRTVEIVGCVESSCGIDGLLEILTEIESGFVLDFVKLSDAVAIGVVEVFGYNCAG